MKKLALLSVTLVVLFGCHTYPTPTAAMAMATIAPVGGSNVNGTVHLQDMPDGSVMGKIDLTGLTPGDHGFHIHENGSCDDNGNAAGPHFNPASAPHGSPTGGPHHAGDFGNITAGANGEAHTTITIAPKGVLSVYPGAISAVGHAFIVHGGMDDLTSQPSGNSGPRIGCGVITLMQ
ncbi:MAG TPA: superoxide dismutase family protein [Thermoanaerobaculia bacterium]|nr:superoxide dismutase family protein [Thermoanaerobaculia bacterium]